MSRPLRFALVAVLVGLAWNATVLLLAPRLERPWTELRGEPYLQLVSCFTSSALLPAWFFRKRLAALHLKGSLVACLLGLVVGPLTFGCVFFLSIYALGDHVEEVRDSHGLLEKLAWSVLCVLYLGVQGVVSAALTAYVSLPLSWLSVLVLRWASGGIEQADARALQAP